MFPIRRCDGILIHESSGESGCWIGETKVLGSLQINSGSRDPRHVHADVCANEAIFVPWRRLESAAQPNQSFPGGNSAGIVRWGSPGQQLDVHGSGPRDERLAIKPVGPVKRIFIYDWCPQWPAKDACHRISTHSDRATEREKREFGTRWNAPSPNPLNEDQEEASSSCNSGKFRSRSDKIGWPGAIGFPPADHSSAAHAPVPQIKLGHLIKDVAVICQHWKP